MRKFLIAIYLLLGITVVAQPNYKYIMQHMSEYSDREALYRLDDYRMWFPQQPHPYYLMGNIYFRLQDDEHPLVDYSTRKLYLYNARLFFGNCRAFISSEKPKAERYPEVAVNGKVDEEMVINYLSTKIKECEDIDHRVDALYEAYCQLVNDYDTCLQQFSLLSNKYTRLKEAQMMLDEEDKATLRIIKEHSLRVNEDIKTFKKALKNYPIEGYDPTFSFASISFYRIDGLVGADFLQNDIVLWDYAAWVDEFDTNQQGVLKLREELGKEYKRLYSYCSAPPKNLYDENKRLLNNLEKYDEGTPMRDLLHLVYQVYTLRSLEQRIICDSVSTEEWVISLQLAYRMNQLGASIQETMSSAQITSLSSASIIAKYTSFIEEFYPANGLPDQQNQNWSIAAINNLSTMLTASNKRVQDWLLFQTQKGMPAKVQINETMVAEIGDPIRFYEEIIEVQNN